MSTISLTFPVSGTVITAGLHATNYTTIQNAINGGLDTANWAAGKIFAPSKIMQEGATNGQVLQWSSGSTQWVPATVASQTYQTTLPGSPVDGQQTILVDSTTAPTYAWLLRYNSTAAKWDFIGGSSIFAEVVTGEATSSTTYVALTTAGPSITVPVAGDYFVEIGFNAGGTTQGTVARMSYDIGGTGAVDADSALATTASFALDDSVQRARKKTALAASTALVSKYRNSGAASMTYANRWMRVTPIRVS